MKEHFPTPILSQSQEDYLKIILELINVKRVARIKEIAQQKNVSMPSVTEAVQKLAADGLVNYSAREFVELTAQGAHAARNLSMRHLFLRNFLIDILSIPPDQANSEACALEHYLSENTLERLILLYQFISSCPNNETRFLKDFRQCLAVSSTHSPQKGACPECFIQTHFPHLLDDQRTIHLLLSELQEGQTGIVVMLGPDAERRHALIARGLVPGCSVHLVRKGTLEKPYELLTTAGQIRLETQFAQYIEMALRVDENEQNQP